MAEQTELKATVREGTGKLANRALREKKMVPGVIYGGAGEPENVALEYRIVWQHYQTGHFLSTVYTLDVDGKRQRVIPRDVQVDPVRDFPIHVDFLRVSRATRLDVSVPLLFTNEEASPGLKRGGVLNVVSYEIELSCPAESIPESITIDLTGFEIGDTVHVSDIKLDEGITPSVSGDFMIATIAGASAEETAGSASGAAEDTKGE